MFQKQLSLFFTLLIFMACSNAKPAQENISTQEELTELKSNIEEPSVIPATEKEAEQVKIQAKSAIEKKKPTTKKVVEKTIIMHESIQGEEKKIMEASESELPETSPIPEITETLIVEEVLPVEEDEQPSHDQWNTLLQKYVSASGKVNYKGFKSDQAGLQAYLDLLAANPVQSSWSSNEKMAYWINAYNAFTVKLIVDNYPVSSIMKIHNGKPWDKKWIKLGDNTYSLNQIENEILRPQFKDARIHFAVNCAAKSCPPLLNRAWTAANLEGNFEKQARNFINNKQFNSIAENKVQLSKIFEWYAGDFGNIISYLNKYASVNISPDAKITYLEYDWALNE